jgi:hypothetical protein
MKRKKRTQSFKCQPLLLLGIFLIVILGSCKDNATEPEVPLASSLELVAGDSQSAEIEAPMLEGI